MSTRSRTAARDPARRGRSDRLGKRYRHVRAATLDLASPLTAEDQLVQAMPEASPTKWHLAHTAWFFETFVLSRFRPELWLSDGWAAVQQERWQAPLYWQRPHGAWTDFTLAGEQPIDTGAPVAHVSYYEADAFARWAGARLPTEAEWEVVAAALPVEGHFVEERRLRPAARTVPDEQARRPLQMFGDVWEWTASAYLPYPRFRPFAGELGEYNGKFMCGQMVLRGGSCLTPRSHVRATYRNFFPPATRWQMSGLLLARWS